MNKMIRPVLTALITLSISDGLAFGAELDVTPDATPALKPALASPISPSIPADASPVTPPPPSRTTPPGTNAAASSASSGPPPSLAKRLAGAPVSATGFLFGTVVGTSVCMVRKFPQELREHAHTIAGSFTDKESKILLFPATLVGIIPAGFMSFLEAPVYSFRDAWMAEKPFSKEQFSLTALDPPERVPHDYVEPVPPVSSTPVAPSSSSSPTSAASLPARMLGAVAGIIVGIPVCAVRRPIAGENYGIDNTAGPHSEPRKKIPAGLLYAPCAIVTGLIESPFYALNNSLVNFNKPFSKQQFSLADEKN